MAQWEKVDTARHKVAIAGQVREELTGQAIGDAKVWITRAPDKFVSRLITRIKLRPLPQPAPQEVMDAWGKLDALDISWDERLSAAQVVLNYLQALRYSHIARADQIRTTADGRFYFLDLPDGKYTLCAAFPSGGTRFGTGTKDATVSNDAVILDIDLPSTALAGRICDQEDEQPIPLAEIRVAGSGEQTLSSARKNPKDSGFYRLTGLEAGARKIRVSARGYKTEDIDVSLNQGETKSLDIKLEKKNHA
jgi:hypothetical protein